MGWVVNATPLSFYPLYIEARWAPLPFWKGAERIAPIAVRSPRSVTSTGTIFMTLSFTC